MQWVFLQKQQTSRKLLPVKQELVSHPGTQVFLQHFHYRPDLPTPEQQLQQLENEAAQVFGSDYTLLTQFFGGNWSWIRGASVREEAVRKIKSAVARAVTAHQEAIEEGDWQGVASEVAKIGIIVAALLDKGLQYKASFLPEMRNEEIASAFSDTLWGIFYMPEIQRLSLPQEEAFRLKNLLIFALAAGLGQYYIMKGQPEAAMPALILGFATIATRHFHHPSLGDPLRQQDAALIDGFVSSLVEAGVFEKWQERLLEGGDLPPFLKAGEAMSAVISVLRFPALQRLFSQTCKAIVLHAKTPWDYGYLEVSDFPTKDPKRLERLKDALLDPVSLLSMVLPPVERGIDSLSMTAFNFPKVVARHLVTKLRQTLPPSKITTILGKLRERCLLSGHHPYLPMSKYLTVALLALEGVRQNLPGANALAKSLLWLGGLLTKPHYVAPTEAFFEGRLLENVHQALLAALGYQSQEEWEKSIPQPPERQMLRELPEEEKGKERPHYDPEDFWHAVLQAIGRKVVKKKVKVFHLRNVPDEKVKDYTVTQLTERLLADKEIRPLLEALGAIPQGATDKVARTWLYPLVDGIIGGWAETALDAHFLMWLVQERAAHCLQHPKEVWDVLQKRKVAELSDDWGAVMQPAGMPNWAERLLSENTEEFLPKTVRGIGRRILFQQRILRTAAPFMDAVLFHIYRATQELLDEAGIPPNATVSLYRGMHAPLAYSPTGEAKVVYQPLSSFSAAYGIARAFGPVHKVERMPRERIFSMAGSGFGCLKEWEVVGALPQAQVVKVL